MLKKLVKSALKLPRDMRASRRKKLVAQRLGLDVVDRFHCPQGTVSSTRKYSVVAAVYRVGKYLDEFMSSIVRQTLDFRDCIQVVLVDDGSDDRSSAMCQEWQRRFPENVVYVRKENGGQASARNLGLEYVTGDWVSFADPDDILDRNYFLSVDRALEGNDDVCMVACNLKFYYERQVRVIDNHPLSYRFSQGARRVRFDEQCDDVQLSASVAFFKFPAIQTGGFKFADIRPCFEDGHLVARYLLVQVNPDVIFVPSAVYYYRKREDGSSTLDGSWAKPERYGALLVNGYLDLLLQARIVKESVPRWLQRTVVYDLAWHFRYLVDQHKRTANVPADLRDGYITLLRKIFSQIDEQVLDEFSLAGFNEFYRLGVKALARQQAVLAEQAEIFAWDANRESLGLRVFFSGSKPEIRLKLAGQEVQPSARKTRRHFFLEEDFLREEILWLDWRGCGVLTAELEGQPVKIRLGRNLSLAQARAVVENHFAPRLADASKLPPVAKLYRYLSATPFYAQRFKDAWLLMDRDTQADDNAEHLYRYIQAHGMPVNAWFVLKKSSHDWARLEKAGFRLLEFGSLAHKMALLNARHLISSHADHYVLSYLPRRYYPDLLRFEFTFLQHGVIKDDLSGWLNSKNIARFICSAQAEWESIAADSNYKFSAREVALTGLPRHDSLLSKSDSSSDRIILVMPTWRQGLVGRVKGAGNDREWNPEFVSSDFYQAWHGLIASPELRALVGAAGYKVVFFPHANLTPYLDAFRVEGVEVLGHSDVGSIQELFVRAAVLLTDYSSVAFEVAYMQKPIIYYQFDEEYVFGGGHLYQKGYFDYRRDGFGPVCTEQSTVLQALQEVLENSACASSPYAERMRNFFAYRDGRCCERVYNLIHGRQAVHGCLPEPQAMQPPAPVREAG